MMKPFLKIGLMLTLLLSAGCTTGVSIKEFADSLHGSHISRLYDLWGRPDYAGSIPGENFVVWETHSISSETVAVTSPASPTSPVDRHAAIVSQYGVRIPQYPYHVPRYPYHARTPTTTYVTTDTSEYCKIRIFLDSDDRILFSEVEASFSGCSNYPRPLDWLASGE